MRDRVTRWVNLAGLCAGIVLGVAGVTFAAAPAFRAEVVGHGPAMVLIPGLNSSGDVWHGLIDRFKDRYTCHALTLAGFAGEAPLEEPSLARFRDAIVQYIDDRRLDRPVIVGHSLGGMLAFWIGATAPDKVGAVIAIDGLPFLPALMNPSATAESSKPNADAIRAAMQNASAEERTRMSALALASMITDSANVTIAQRGSDASDPKTTARLAADLMTTDLRPEVARIKTPVLLVAAAGPFASSSEALQHVEQAYERQIAPIPTHRTILAVISRHFIMFDDLAFLTTAMNDFLGSDRSSAR
jgi:N-formylmaleamate deformylase